MKSLTKGIEFPVVGVLGLLFLIVAAWVAFGVAAGLGATGVSLLFIDSRLGEK